MMESKLGLTLGLILVLCFAFASSFVSADYGIAGHTAGVTLNPDISNCNVPNEFTVNVEKLTGYDIYDVKIKKTQVNIDSLTCGDAPAGWTKIVDDAFFCHYRADDPTGNYTIGEVNYPVSLDFTFDATLNNPTECSSVFTVSTLDNEGLLTSGDGEERKYDLYLRVDCEDPNITKTVGDPKILGDGFDWWITDDTLIDFWVTDNYDSQDDDNCNLGMDYCEYIVEIDGVYSSFYSDNFTDDKYDINWSEIFGEDSNHEIWVTCYDLAGNKDELYEWDKVDMTSPNTTKWFDGPQKLVPVDGTDYFVEWIDSVTKVMLSTEDPDPTGYQCNVGVDKTWWRNILYESGGASTQSVENGNGLYAPCYYPELYCNTDYLGNSTPYDDPQVAECINDQQDWCTENWQLGGDHDSWEDCVNDRVHSAFCDVDPTWSVWDGNPIPKNEESCHIFQYFSVDHLGNVENVQHNCFFVDKTAPEVVKDVGEPNVYWGEIVDAADRIFDLQNNDGGWDWIVTDYTTPGESTASNINGVTALVLLDAYQLTGELRYLNAAEDAGDYLIDHLFSGSSVDISQRVNGFDVVFLYELGMVSDDPDYESAADSLLQNVLTEDNFWSNNFGSHCSDTTGCTAQNMYDAIDNRRSGNLGIMLWDLAPWVEAADLGGEGSWADDLETIMNAQYGSLSSGDSYYVLGLSALVLATGNPSAASDLLIEQDADGSWDGSIQDTAYALMALVEVGEVDAADAAAFYLVNNLGYLGTLDGWLESNGEEYSEVTSEAAQALYYIDFDQGAWITNETDIMFSCSDQDPHPSGDETLCFKVWYDEEGDMTDEYCSGSLNNEGYCCVDVSGGSFTFNFDDESDGDSQHSLEYYCEDAVEKRSDVFTQYYRVDNTAPSLIRKIINGPYWGDCPPAPGSDDICHIDGVTTIDVEVEDGGDVCAVGVDMCRWKYRVDRGDGYSGYTDWNYTFPISFPEESEHELVIECEDRLGNIMEDVEVFFVDKTAPETTFGVTGPQYPDPITEDDRNYPRWIDTVSRIVLNATDEYGPHDSGVAETWYRVTEVADGACWTPHTGCSKYSGSGDFVKYNEPFGINESCHLVEYYSVDNVGKVEDLEKQCVFSDHTAPSVSIGVEGPSEECVDCYYWVNNQTDIKLNCNNLGPHASPLDVLSWRIKIDNKSWGEWMESPAGVDGMDVVFNFKEDSRHYLQYKCNDTVGKVSRTYETLFRVDSTAPEITISESDPKYFDGEKLFLNHVTSVSVSAVDPDPTNESCNIQNVSCDWGYYLDDSPELERGWNAYEGPIVFPEDTKHEFVVRCEDGLGNVHEETKTYYVDWTAPGIVKEYGEPMVYLSGEGYTSKFVTSDTPIFVDIIDLGPHKSGIKEANYRTTVFDDDTLCMNDDSYDVAASNGVQYDYYCNETEGDGEWLIIDSEDYDDFEFNIPEDSCHLIEIMAMDNVEKCALHKQWVYVDNQAPLPNKTVGEPKDPWDGADANFYDIDEFCETPGNCWKVTMDTPISMACEDPEPHPVGNEKVCFNVELDGDDWTGGDNGYCDHYGGEMTGDSYLEGGFDWDQSNKLPVWQYEDGTKVPIADVGGSMVKTMQNGNRVYEYSVPLSVLGVSEGDQIRIGTYILDGVHKAHHRIRNSMPDKDDFSWSNTDNWELYDLFNDGVAITVDGDLSEWTSAMKLFIDTDAYDESNSQYITHGYDLYVTVNGGMLYVAIDYTDDMTDEGDVNPDFGMVFFEVDNFENYCCFNESIGQEFYFLESSEHNLKFYCEDALGNKGPVDDEKFKVDGEGFEIQINKKWNLISVPVVLLNDDPEEVFENVDVDNCIQSVWAYDGLDDEWSVWTPSEAPDNLRVKPGYGYWLVANEDCNLTIGGSLLSPARLPPSRELTSGWNLIGYYGMEDSYGNKLDGYYGPSGAGSDAYCAFYSLTSGELGLPKWSSLYGYWELNNPDTFDTYSMFSNLDPGAGYWINLKDNQENYVYSPSTVCTEWWGGWI